MGLINIDILLIVIYSYLQCSKIIVGNMLIYIDIYLLIYINEEYFLC